MDASDIKRLDTRLKTLRNDLWRGGPASRHRKFYCPVLLVEEMAELCKGHVVPNSVGEGNGCLNVRM